MDGSPFARATGFLADFARRQAAQVRDVPGGFAVLSPEYAASYIHNRLILTAPADPAAVVAAADEVLGGAGLPHRWVDVFVDIDGAPFETAGYQPSENLVMCHTGAQPDGPADPAIRVEEIDLATMIDSARREWRAEYPDLAAEGIDQLARRRAGILRGADEVTFLGVREQGLGELAGPSVSTSLVARADLYVDRSTGVAQIEDVMTDSAHRNRGLARALLAEGLRRARTAGSDLVFLVASADDWPQELYARLGYATAGRTHEFLRLPPVSSAASG
jgi:ribosomal protein S18 acetylase RimI-like enzyme